MTTITCTREPGLARSWLVLCLLAVVATVALWPRTLPAPAPYIVVPPHIGVKLSDAIAHHGITEVTKVRNCFDKGGADIVYRQKLGNIFRFHLLCRLPNGTWVDRVIENINGTWEEITAFIPQDGSLKAVLDWLGRKAASKITTMPWR